MNARMHWLGLALLAGTFLGWTSGCSDKKNAPVTKDGKQAEAKKDSTHEKHDHKKGGSQDDEHDKALTEKDVKMPDSFKAGVARLEELQMHVRHLIEGNELSKVHRAAEEMALVANATKRLAAKDLPEDKQTEAGRYCNEVASSYKPIDEAADAGKKAETEAIHKKMGTAVENLKKLTK